MVTYSRVDSHSKIMKPCWFQVALILAVAFVATCNAKSNRFSPIDVNGEEGTIDQIHDYMASHPVKSHRQIPNDDKINEKIEFGVGPGDPRFFSPPKIGFAQKHNLKNDPYTSNNLPLRDNNVRNAIPQDPRLYQKGDYYRDNKERFPGMDLNQLPNTLINSQQDDRYRQYGIPDYQRSVDLNSNRYQIQRDPQNLEREQWQEQLIATNKQPHVSNRKHESHSKDTDPKDAESPNVDNPPVNYLRMSPVHAEEPVPVHPAEFNNHVSPGKKPSNGDRYVTDFTFTAIVAGCTTIAVFGVIGTGVCWYRLNKNQRATADAEYPAYGVTGPSKDMSPGAADRKLAQSAHMYHYQHQKQQMIALDKSGGGDRQGSASDVDTDEEGEDGDYTVYECPGLASTGEMEVKNPLFQDEPTPVTPSQVVKDDRQHTPQED